MKEITNRLTTLIRDELANSQINKENNTAEYLLGKNEAYSKVLSLITKILKE
jgi:C4-type Zn-finger protein